MRRSSRSGWNITCCEEARWRCAPRRRHCSRTRPELASPDVKLSIQPFSADRPQDGLHPWSGFSMIAYQLRPDSRGQITLKSADPSASPAVYPNYLTAETDQRTIVAGLKLCRQLL